MGCDPFVENDKEAWFDVVWTGKLDPANWATHYLFYYLCKLQQARETIEIGVGRGHGTYMFGLHAKEVGGHHTAIEIAPHVARRATQIAEAFDLPVTVLNYDSKAIAWQKRVDLCYVDGGHSTEQVLGDIKTYSPWIKRNGLIIFDDYGVKHQGVTEAVDQSFGPSLWEMMIWPWNRWAIWRRK